MRVRIVYDDSEIFRDDSEFIYDVNYPVVVPAAKKKQIIIDDVLEIYQSLADILQLCESSPLFMQIMLFEDESDVGSVALWYSFNLYDYYKKQINTGNFKELLFEPPVMAPDKICLKDVIRSEEQIEFSVSIK